MSFTISNWQNYERPRHHMFKKGDRNFPAYVLSNSLLMIYIFYNLEEAKLNVDQFVVQIVKLKTGRISRFNTRFLSILISTFFLLPCVLEQKYLCISGASGLFPHILRHIFLKFQACPFWSITQPGCYRICRSLFAYSLVFTFQIPSSASDTCWPGQLTLVHTFMKPTRLSLPGALYNILDAEIHASLHSQHDGYGNTYMLHCIHTC